MQQHDFHVLQLKKLQDTQESISPLFFIKIIRCLYNVYLVNSLRMNDNITNTTNYLFYTTNKLHYNHYKKIWSTVSA